MGDIVPFAAPAKRGRPYAPETIEDLRDDLTAYRAELAERANRNLARARAAQALVRAGIDPTFYLAAIAHDAQRDLRRASVSMDGAA